MKFLLYKNVPLNSIDKLGRTALHIAFIKENGETIDLVFDKNINLKKKDNYGKTAFEYSRWYSWHRHIES